MEAKFLELSQFILDLQKRYLNLHLNPRKQHRKLNFDMDVRAFCLFSHAAIEQYFEELAEHALLILMAQWDSGNPISKPAMLSLMSLLISEGVVKTPIEDDESKPQGKPLHIVSEILRERAKSYKKKISDNHGASLKYLRFMFAPLGIYIDPEPSADNALRRLASSRGAFAHRRTPQKTGHYVYKPITPEDALVAASDCLKYCKFLMTEIPMSPSEDFYSAQMLYLSAHRARLASVLKKISEIKNEKRQGRLPN